ncbi:aquaporin [Streptomyces sp. NBC_00237]|uniref:aquaporin n=1 Tax=Streptomyces sp. NBC_00237 TaxID=2975687 RepID=UPI00224D29AD|nr:aquaporin [Streptomyces sp. NBC_00237]MCX5199914.1 aquaporin [Streptomyces sp. NBC_00237]
MRNQLRYAVAELVLTAALLFLVVTAVRWLLAPDSPAVGAAPDPTLRLAGVALAVGAAIALVMSPAAQRFTAGHLNPAVTVGLWALRELPGRAVLPFVAAQLAGSALGMGLGRAVWGPMADTAAVAPGETWGGATVLVLEAVAMAAMMLLAAYALIAPRVARALPPLMGASVAGAIVGLGPVTGGAVNPARQFGPALWSGQTAHLVAYLVAPVLGALLAAAVFRAVRPQRKAGHPPLRKAGASTPPPRPAEHTSPTGPPQPHHAL